MNNFDKKQLIKSGKSKNIYKTNDDKYVIVEYTNQITAFNKLKHDNITDKGKSIKKISTYLFKELSKAKIPHHYIEDFSDHEQVCLNCEMIPLEMIVRNKAAGSVVKRYAIKEGTEFKPALVTFDYKSDELGDPMISESQIIAFNILNRAQIDLCIKLCLEVNEVLKTTFNKLGIDLIDFKLEFGFDQNKNIVLSDELGPDNMRLHSFKNNEVLDKDVYRNNLGDVGSVYAKLASLIPNN